MVTGAFLKTPPENVPDVLPAQTHKCTLTPLFESDSVTLGSLFALLVSLSLNCLGCLNPVYMLPSLAFILIKIYDVILKMNEVNVLRCKVSK